MVRWVTVTVNYFYVLFDVFVKYEDHITASKNLYNKDNLFKRLYLIAKVKKI